MELLIVIGNMGCGGAQKSLASFLDMLTPKHGFNIDLLILNEKNMFFDEIPDWINVIHPEDEIKGIFTKASDIKNSSFSSVVRAKCLMAKAKQKLFYKKECDSVQNVWNAWKTFIPKRKKSYDIAISYVDGFPNYYVIDKVKAKKKVLWVHNEYEKLTYNSAFDSYYFGKADKIITISDRCVDSLKKTFPQYAEKFFMLPNLSSAESILRKAKTGKPAEYGDIENIFVSIGRLNEQKGFDVAIKAAAELKREGLAFKWFILGEGELKEALLKQIAEENVADVFELLGNRSNPYPYLLYSSLFVQPSRYEGKSIVLDEAKILCKPIVVTAYDTVRDSITDGENGIICKFDVHQIAESIRRLLGDEEMKERFKAALEKENAANSQTVELYVDMLHGLIRSE